MERFSAINVSMGALSKLKIAESWEFWRDKIWGAGLGGIRGPRWELLQWRFRFLKATEEVLRYWDSESSPNLHTFSQRWLCLKGQSLWSWGDWITRRDLGESSKRYRCCLLIPRDPSHQLCVHPTASVCSLLKSPAGNCLQRIKHGLLQMFHPDAPKTESACEFTPSLGSRSQWMMGAWAWKNSTFAPRWDKLCATSYTPELPAGPGWG